MVSNQQTGDKQELKTLLLDIDSRYVGHMALNFTVCLWKVIDIHVQDYSVCIIIVLLLFDYLKNKLHSGWI